MIWKALLYLAFIDFHFHAYKAFHIVDKIYTSTTPPTHHNSHN
ncbi:hypothetical protein COO91_10519 (plasmid) [Nostoc flagelliforme CCNUN1]|uniref:Uncharacterized protein n=1 Tax=Nostoc flagelliforme CCNUN1 TaxID=2038116 RepID=A0A2K8T9C2_9NOSO|nr:hypothetical protein COO91_10519 [Nostoc flagelliforme CCNUN1]